MTFPGGSFPGVRALIDVIGQLEDVDFSLMLRLLREGVTLEQLRKFYWEKEDFLFMAPVKEIIDAYNFTFIWRGRVLVARGIPNTGDLIEGELALIRKLPASKEYFHINLGLPPVMIAGRIDIGSTIPVRFAYTLNILDSSPVWVENSTGLPSDSDNVTQLFGDGATEYMILDPAGVSGATEELWRNIDPLESGVWEKVLDIVIINALLGTSFTNIVLSAPAARVDANGNKTLYVIVDTIAAGNDYLFHSHDDGDTWTAVMIPPDVSVEGENNYYSMGVGIQNTDLVYIYGSFGSTNKEERVSYSDDGGHTITLRWDELLLNSGFGYLGLPVAGNPSEDIVFLGAAVPGANRPLVRSSDGAQNFSSYSSELHRPIFSRANANAWWDVGTGATARRVFRSNDAGLSYSFVDVGSVTNYLIRDAILHRNSLMVLVGRRGTVIGVPTGPTVYSSPDKINFTGRDGNIDTAFFYGLQSGVIPEIRAVDFYTIAKQSVLNQG